MYSVLLPSNLSLELLAFKSLPKTPIFGCYIVRYDCNLITRGYLKGKGLVLEICIYMPILAPVPPHCEPPSCWALDLDGNDVTCACNIADQHRKEVACSVDCKPNATFLYAFDPVLTKSATLEKEESLLGDIVFICRQVDICKSRNNSCIEEFIRKFKSLSFERCDIQHLFLKNLLYVYNTHTREELSAHMLSHGFLLMFISTARCIGGQCQCWSLPNINSSGISIHMI